MTLTVTIGGVEMTGSTHYVVEDSVSHTNALGQRDTWTCKIASADGSYLPEIGAAVLVEDESAARFGGTIRQLQTDQFGAALLSTIGCASWEQLFDRRFTGERTYTGWTAGAIFEDLLIICMAGDDVTASIVITGPVIASVTFNFATVREAFDQLVALASDDTDTYMWDSTPARVTRFYKQTSFAAPFNVTDASDEVLHQGGSVRISASWSLDKYTNRVFPRMSQLITDERTETFAGTGSQTSFSTELPIAAAPTITLIAQVADLSEEVTEYVSGDGYSREFYLWHKVASITSITKSGIPYTLDYAYNSDRLTDSNVDPLGSGDTVEIVYQYCLDTTSGAGVAQTVGEAGLDTGKQWYWTRSSNSIDQDSGGTALTTSQTLQVVYRGYDNRVLPAVQDDGEVAARAAAEGGLGRHETIIDSDTPGTAADATARALAWLGRFARIGGTVEYPTGDSGVRAGQHQTIAISGLVTSATFLVESVTMSQAGGLYLWRVKAVSGALAGDYKMRLRELRGGSGSSSVSGGGAVVSEDSSSVTIDGAPITY